MKIVPSSIRKNLQTFWGFIVLAFLVLGLAASVILVTERQEIRKEAVEHQFQLYYKTDFKSFQGWEKYPRDGKIDIFDGTWAHLYTPNKAQQYPGIRRHNELGKLIPTQGDFRIQIRYQVKYQNDTAGYGISMWLYKKGQVAKQFPGFTWHRNKGLELRLFNSKKVLPADKKIHIWELTKAGNNWTVRLDGIKYLTETDPGTNPRLPDAMNFGDPTTQAAGIWPEMYIDWVEVYERVPVTPTPSPSPSPTPTLTPTPTPPPCTPEGQTMPVYPGYECCSGLNPISTAKPDANGNCPLNPPLGASVCAKCGNGVCGLGENKCNCPKDCVPTPTGTPSPTSTPTPGCELVGDFNCDGEVDLLDFEIFRDFYVTNL